MRFKQATEPSLCSYDWTSTYTSQALAEMLLSIQNICLFDLHSSRHDSSLDISDGLEHQVKIFLEVVKASNALETTLNSLATPHHPIEN